MVSAPSRLHPLAGESSPASDGHAVMRKPSLPLGFVGGLLAAVLGGLLTVMTVSGTDHRRPVLAVARPVAAGDPITAADLRVVRVGVDAGVTTVPATEQRRMIGRAAATRLAPGSLLVPSAIGSVASVPAGGAEVGLLLEPGRFPPNLQAGDHVLVVSVPAGPTAAATSTSLGDAVVESIAAAPGGSGMVARLRLDRAVAPAVAAEGAARRVAVVVVSPGGTTAGTSMPAASVPAAEASAPTSESGAGDGNGAAK